MNIKVLSANDTKKIKYIIYETFSREPWNDEWTDEKQFHQYIIDLTGNQNSLSLGLYDDAGELIGVSLGRIKHWYKGNEYWIDDLAILPKSQGKGFGLKFIDLIEDYLKNNNINGIVLFTERDIPAYNLYVKKEFKELKKRVFFEKSI